MISVDPLVNFSHYVVCFLMAQHLRYGREKPLLYKTSLIITNREARTFSFLAASFPSGRMPDLKYAINGVVQFSSTSISYICAPSFISEEVWTKDNTCLDAFINSAEAAFARRSAHSFSSLGI